VKLFAVILACISVVSGVVRAAETNDRDDVAAFFAWCFVVLLNLTFIVYGASR
jgi:hypothetical protein